MPSAHTRNWQPAVVGGLVAGLAGALVFSAVLVAMTHASGGDVWTALKFPGSPFLGNRSLAPGFDPVALLVGVLSHLGVAAVWGLLFSLLFYGLSWPATIAAGALWGVVAWLGMFYVVLPTVRLGSMASRMPAPAAILEHVAFGLAMALAFLPFQRGADAHAHDGGWATT